MNVHSALHKVRENLKIASESSYFLIHQVRYEFIIQEVEKISSGKKLKILDIGCFPYHIGASLEFLGHQVFGISSYHEPIKRKNVVMLNIETEKFPFEKDFFDLVLFNEIIEHLPQSPLLALKEIRRVTKERGHVMVTTPNIARSINRCKLLLGKNIMYPIDVYFEEEGKGNNIYHRHNREYTLGELCEVLAKTSWQIVRKNYFISYTPFRKKEVVDPWWLYLGKLANYLLMLVFPASRDTLLVIGKK